MKKSTKTEKKLVLLWLTNQMTTADFARRIKVNPRHGQVYVRAALTLKELFTEGVIAIN